MFVLFNIFIVCVTSMSSLDDHIPESDKSIQKAFLKVMSHSSDGIGNFEAVKVGFSQAAKKYLLKQ